MCTGCIINFAIELCMKLLRLKLYSFQFSTDLENKKNCLLPKAKQFDFEGTMILPLDNETALVSLRIYQSCSQAHFSPLLVLRNCFESFRI